jgi:hypothetical protein
MDTQKTDNQPSLFTSKMSRIKKILLSILTIIVIIVLASILLTDIAKSTIEPQAPAAQARYDQLKNEAKEVLKVLCREGWQPLSKAKIMDESNGLGKETPRMDHWNSNLKFDCSNVTAPEAF